VQGIRRDGGKTDDGSEDRCAKQEDAGNWSPGGRGCNSIIVS